jgi:uncharacterized protein GlcG (DUF336 family)
MYSVRCGKIFCNKENDAMRNKELTGFILQLIENVEGQIPSFMANEEDRLKANGNVAICVVDEEGAVYGKVFGTDKIRGREAYRVAWMKASQVWITGMRTGEFERRVFNKEIDEKEFGIRRPDYIGWEGGQPLTLQDGTKLSVGFSGFRSESDLEIVARSIPPIAKKSFE